MMKKIISILLLSLSFSVEDSINQEFLLFPGPNLVSFNVTTDDLSIQSYLESIEDNIISIITQGEIGLFINDQWILVYYLNNLYFPRMKVVHEIF